MQPRDVWSDDPIFVEISVQDGDVAWGLSHEGFSRYLGVGGDRRRIAALQVRYPRLADRLTYSHRRKLVLNNNAQVLILSGRSMLHVWKYRSVRHARCVAWPVGLGLLPLIALIGCLLHMLGRHYSLPRLVCLPAPGGRRRWLLASRVLRHKICRRGSLHFIPHEGGLTGFFQQLNERRERYVVLRWFDSLPEIEPDEDVDLLVADDSLPALLQIVESRPGILPCDVYSESGLARSAFCGTPYYPPEMARKILDSAVRHKDLVQVPNRGAYFHSLAYHAVYHKGSRANLAQDDPAPQGKKSSHDFAGILGQMADELGIHVDISLPGLHDYLQASGWGPSPEMLARLAVVHRSNRWLKSIAGGLAPHVRDEGLAVFVLREEAVRRGFQDQIVDLLQQDGFEVLATRVLSASQRKFSAARTRGGNWLAGKDFDRSGGVPAAAVVVYDREPIPLTRRQLRRFPKRTNARIFAKERIRDAIIAQLPASQGFNALHSSDNAAEAWHLIEVLAPELLDEVRAHLRRMHRSPTPTPAADLRRAA